MSCAKNHSFLNPDTKIVNNRISTTKADKINHGLGLYSINKSVEKYNGSVNIECDNNVFSINILLVDTKKTWYLLIRTAIWVIRSGGCLSV